ncbi:MAG: M23 family metallopeptidase, partial [Negativicoccus succinicivorans]|nr:M23 family metallopeptidase [Negativicoccus succinicivorans]
GHNSLIIAEVGDKVQTGTVISFMGSTGRSTGSHVHYEVRVNGVPVDPMLFLPTKK